MHAYTYLLAIAEQVGPGLAERGIDPVVVSEQSSVVFRSYKLQAGLTYSAQEGRICDLRGAGGFVENNVPNLEHARCELR